MNLNNYSGAWVSVLSGVVALSLGFAGSSSAAAPDTSGAVDPLVSTSFAPAGDAVGGVGLIGASVVGGVGDLVALVDDNRYSTYVTNGVVSRHIDRASLGLSNMSTGLLEGFRGEDRASVPERPVTYTGAPDSIESRVNTRAITFARGIGALIPLTAADAVGNPLLILARLSPTKQPAHSIESWKASLADFVLGPRS